MLVLILNLAVKSGWMKNKTKRMDEIRQILEAYHACGYYKRTARRLQVSKNTVKSYVHRAQAAFGTVAQALVVEDGALQEALCGRAAKAPPPRDEAFDAQLGHWCAELKKVGVTRYLLWQVHDCQVLVAVLPYSQYNFAIALPSQKVLDLAHGITEALLFFGGVPQAILSDNLKAFVARPERYEPEFNELCVQLAAHYGCGLEAARPGKPKDKASVENMVSTVYKRVYAPLRDDTFYSLSGLNYAIAEAVAAHNRLPFQKRPGSRLSCFEAEEKPLLQALPSHRFEAKKSTCAKVQRNYHVFLGEEKNFYSVPYQYVGKQAHVTYTSRAVEVFVGQKRVASHQRLPPHGTYLYQTQEGHMPRSHQEWRKAQGYDAAYFAEQAQKIVYWVGHGPGAPLACPPEPELQLLPGYPRPRQKIYPAEAGEGCRALPGRRQSILRHAQEHPRA